MTQTTSRATAPISINNEDFVYLLEELDLILDAYNSLQAICAASDVEASTVFAILHQLNLNYRRTLECFGVPL